MILSTPTIHFLSIKFLFRDCSPLRPDQDIARTIKTSKLVKRFDITFDISNLKNRTTFLKDLTTEWGK